MSNVTDIAEHYAARGLLQRITAALAEAGAAPDTVTLEDLETIDEFHGRGIAATTELIMRLRPSPKMHVLDVGAGLGGPARRLAAATGCRVTGIDLSSEFCEVGTEISRWLGMAERVALVQGDATDLSAFADHSFDAAWSIHAAMNIADKPALYGEIARVLKPGAVFLAYDVVAAAPGDLRYPLPWASDASTNFLATATQMQDYLIAAGFSSIEFKDFSDVTLQAIYRRDGAAHHLSQHVVMGARFPIMARNVAENLKNGHLAVYQVYAVNRPG